MAYVGPRDGPNAGGSFRTASLRLSGTLVGALWGYAALLLGGGLGPGGRVDPSLNGGGTYWLLALGVVIAGVVRHSPTHAYGPLVAQFTSFIMVVNIRDVGDVQGDSKRWSYLRIETNVLGERNAPPAPPPLLAALCCVGWWCAALL